MLIVLKRHRDNVSTAALCTFVYSSSYNDNKEFWTRAIESEWLVNASQ